MKINTHSSSVIATICLEKSRSFLVIFHRVVLFFVFYAHLLHPIMVKMHLNCSNFNREHFLNTSKNWWKYATFEPYSKRHICACGASQMYLDATSVACILWQPIKCYYRYHASNQIAWEAWRPELPIFALLQCYGFCCNSSYHHDHANIQSCILLKSVKLTWEKTVSQAVARPKALDRILTFII